MKKKEIDLSDAVDETGKVLENKDLGRITQIVYKTNKNLGNHEHESVELYCSVGEGESALSVFDDLKIMAYEALNPDEEMDTSKGS